MEWRPIRRGSILITSGPTHDAAKKHLFVICELSETEALLVSISTWTNDLCDPACRLAAGAHPFVKVPSYVMYRKSRIEAQATLIKGVSEGVFIVRQDFGEEIFERICEGFGTSKQVPWKIKRFFERWRVK